jgi:hypothetical protein
MTKACQKFGTRELLAASNIRENEMANLVMTPHMNGWTIGTVLRRQQTIAENIRLRRLSATNLL